MTRKFAWWGLSFLSGLVLFCADMGESLWVFVSAAVAAGALMFAALKKYRVYVLSVVVCVLLGLFCGEIYTCFRYDKTAALDGKTVTIDGFITDYAYIGSDSCRITVKGKINGVSAKVTYFADNDDYEYYEKVSVTGEVKLIKDTLNFQSAEYYYPKGVFLQGSGDVKITRSGECANIFLRAVKQFRDYTAHCLSATLEKEQSGFLKALLCGDRSDVDSVTKTKLYRSGTGHMFAVSGTHLTAVSMFVSLLAGWLVSSKKIRFAVTEAVILGFMAFAGFSPSVTRAGIMLSAVYCSDVFRRRADCLNSLGICCVFMGVTDPYVVKDPAFILSFAAAFAVGAVYPKLAALTGERLKGPLKYVIMTTVILFVTMPFAAKLFSETSVISPLTNLIMTPMCTLALVMCFSAMLFGGAGALSQILFRLSGALASAVMKCADFFSAFEFAAMPSRYLHIMTVFALVGWLGIFLAVKSGRLRVFIAAAAAVYGGLFCCTAFVRMADKDRMHIIILPQDKGCAALVYQNGSGEILDIGSKGSAVYPLQRALSSRGVVRLNAVFIGSGYYYTRNIYENELYSDCENYISVNNGSAFSEFNEAVIESSEGGYTVSCGDKSVFIGKDCFAAEDNVYDLTEESCPVEIVFDGDRSTIRRLDYAFN